MQDKNNIYPRALINDSIIFIPFLISFQQIHNKLVISYIFILVVPEYSSINDENKWKNSKTVW